MRVPVCALILLSVFVVTAELVIASAAPAGSVPASAAFSKVMKTTKDLNRELAAFAESLRKS